jgi:hypothetical protein
MKKKKTLTQKEKKKRGKIGKDRIGSATANPRYLQ